MNSVHPFKWVLKVPSVYREGPDDSVTRKTLQFVWAGFAIITLLGAWCHEPWRDEAFVWLLSRDLDLRSLTRELRYNGSPGLWHYALHIVTRVTDNYFAQSIVHWLIASAAAGLLLFRAPFHFAVRIALTLSYYSFYEHAVVVRGYALTVLLLYLAAMFHRSRSQRPALYGLILALLANATFFGLLAAMVFGAQVVYEGANRRLQWRGFIPDLLIMGGISFSVYSIWPAADALHYYASHFSFFRPTIFLFGLGAGLVGLEAFVFSTYLIGAIVGITTAVLLIATVYRSRTWLSLTLFVFTWSAIFYLVTFKYRWTATRHFTFLLVFVVIALWINDYRKNCPVLYRALFVLLMGIGVVSGAQAGRAYYQEFFGVYYAAPLPMSRYLRDHGLTGNLIVGHRDAHAAPILMFLPEMKLWYPIPRKLGTWLHFGSDSRNALTLPEVVERTVAVFKRARGILFLLNEPVPPEIACHFKLVRQINGRKGSLLLYRVIDTYNGKGPACAALPTPAGKPAGQGAVPIHKS